MVYVQVYLRGVNTAGSFFSSIRQTDNDGIEMNWRFENNERRRQSPGSKSWPLFSNLDVLSN